MKILRYRITIEDLNANAVQELPLSADAEHALISCQRLSQLLNSIDYRISLDSVAYCTGNGLERVEINPIDWGL